jgi:Cytochrome P450
MLDMVNARRNADTKEERYDLFSGLLDAAREDSDGGVAMSDRELIGKSLLSHCITSSEELLLYISGNMFIFLLAGHEVGLPPTCSVQCALKCPVPQTTAHTLCFSFALLALYPDEQDRLYQHVKSVMSSLNRKPVSWTDFTQVKQPISCRPTKI